MARGCSTRLYLHRSGVTPDVAGWRPRHGPVISHYRAPFPAPLSRIGVKSGAFSSIGAFVPTYPSCLWTELHREVKVSVSAAQSLVFGSPPTPGAGHRERVRPRRSARRNGMRLRHSSATPVDRPRASRF